MGIFDFLSGAKSAKTSHTSPSTAIEHECRESLNKLREWAASQSESVRASFAIVASPNDFQLLWVGYQKQVPNTKEDRRAREMARSMGLPFEVLSPNLLIGNVYDVLQGRGNGRLPNNLAQWIDAVVVEYQKNARASGMI